MVGIVGEAGIGKSRLLAEFCHSLLEQTVTYLEGHCLAYGSTIPYLPVLALLRQACHLLDIDTPDIIRIKVHQLLQTVDLVAAEAAPYLLHLLGIQTDTEPLAVLTPEAIRGQTFATLRQVILKSCHVRPLILAVENLHWIDATSEAFLTSLVEHCAGVPLLFLATYRPGYRLPWINSSWAAQLTLQPLAHHDSQRVVQGMTTNTQVPPDVVQQILTKAEGNPFFLEELTQAALEHHGASQPLVIPDTIQGVLMARLDRLPESPKQLLSTAAVIGRNVPRWLLDMPWEGSGDLDTHLRVLQRLEFLYEYVASDEPTYHFKHALTRDVAYESLHLQRRQSLHAAAGRGLEERYAGRLEDAVEHLAYHYAHSTVSAKAVTYLTQLADRAARSHAHTEAMTALRQALEHATRLPAGERERCRLDLIIRLTFSLSVLGRFQECLSFILASQEDFARLDEPALMSQYYFRLGITYNYLGDYTQGTQSAQRALEAAQRCSDTAILGKAYYVSAMAAYMTGQFPQSAAYGQQAVAGLEQTAEWHYLGLAYYFVGISHGLMGNFHVACEALDRLEALGQTIGDARLQSFAAHSLGWIYAMQGHWDVGIAACQRSLACAPTPFDAVMARGFLGYAYLEQGDSQQAISLLHTTVEHLRQSHFWPGLGRIAPVLGEAYLLHGDLAMAQDAAQE